MNSLNRFLQFGAIVLSLALAFVINACDDDDPALPPIEADFATISVGLEEGQEEVDLALNLSRAAEAATEFTVTYTTTGVEYGTHFTTEPAASGNTFTVTVPAQSSTISFKVVRNTEAILEGEGSVAFTVAAKSSNVTVGDRATATVSFSPIISEGQTLTLNGLIADEDGADAGNAVFVDFSSNTQTAVARTAWDIGFYAGEDFRVILNNTVAATAIPMEETALDAVNGDDVDESTLAIGQGQGNMSIIDDVDGDLSKTAIAAISATDAENKIYVINRIGGKGTTTPKDEMIKLRVFRSGSGYTLQYAKLNETTFREVEISKSDTHEFTYFSFTTNSTVSVAPADGKWDIQWTYSMYKFSPTIPYGFSDFVFINNRTGVSAVQVLAADGSYADFDEADAAQLTFSEARAVIGSNWRATTGTPLGVRTDRYYVVKDAAGNIYKLRFVSSRPEDSGQRGKPVIEYALVVKGAIG